jgi:uncharacterized membrane protein HdeD (DUF308 family)
MKNNMGKMDRIIRVVVGVLLVGNFFVGTGHIASWIGVILIATGAIGFCPAYFPFKFDSRSAAEKVGLK